MLYALSSSDFHDIVSGASTGTPRYSAGPGYDLVTGRGSPVANLVVNDLVGTPAAAFSGTAPTISSVVVAEAVRKNGILESNEQGVLTCAVTPSNPITAVLMKVDGTSVTAVYGPYGPYSGDFYYAGVFGPLAAGNHSYVIQVIDAAGLTASISGSFVVAPTSRPVISSVVVAEAAWQNGILESNEQGVVTWAVTDLNQSTSRSLAIDGAAATAIYGPYGPYSGSVYYAGVFGPLVAGSHSYTIQVTDSAGGSANMSGNFTVASPVAVAVAAARYALPTESVNAARATVAAEAPPGSTVVPNAVGMSGALPQVLDPPRSAPREAPAVPVRINRDATRLARSIAPTLSDDAGYLDLLATDPLAAGKSVAVSQRAELLTAVMREMDDGLEGKLR